MSPRQRLSRAAEFLLVTAVLWGLALPACSLIGMLGEGRPGSSAEAWLQQAAPVLAFVPPLLAGAVFVRYLRRLTGPPHRRR
jgi:hypothetical protein